MTTNESPGAVDGQPGPIENSACVSGNIVAAADQQSDASDSKLTAALRLARMGFRVFPLIEGTKQPLVKDWPAKATTDPTKITAWWRDPVTGWEADYNIGIATGGGLVVIDVDNKDGKRGADTLAALEREHGALPATLEAATPNGGRHLFFRIDGAATTDASRIGEGIDTRGDGGFVAAVGSAIGGRNYRWLRPPDTPIAECPAWLAGMVGRRAPRERNATNDIGCDGPLDEPAAIARATRYLEENAEPSVQGCGGQHNAYKVACRVRDFGVSEAQCLELMLDQWNERCEPPWPADELSTPVANAYRYAQNAPGSASAAADFEPVAAGRPEGSGVDLVVEALAWTCPADIERHAAALAELRARAPDRYARIVGWLDMASIADPADVAAIVDRTVADAAARPRLHLEWFGDIAPSRQTRPLIRGLLDRGALSLVYGPSNVGKTFFVLDLGMHVALGWPWRGRKVEQGCVVYVAAEGGGSVRKRVAAFRARHGLSGHRVPFALIPCPVDLHRDATHAKAIVQLVQDAAREIGAAPVLIVVDTLARAMGGGNENASEDMGRFIGRCDLLRTATGAHVLIVHHDGKDETKGARGHSSLRAAADTEIKIVAGAATVTKQRDYEGGTAFQFKLLPVDLGHDEDGEPVASCVVEAVDTPQHDFGRGPPPEPTGQAGDLLATLRTMSGDTAATGPASTDDADTVFDAGPWLQLSDVRAAAVAAWAGNDGNRKSAYTAVKRAIDKLATGGHAECDGNRIRLSRHSRHVD